MLFVAIAVVLVVVPALVVLALRQCSVQHEETESRLGSPGAHTVCFIVPPGQDPAPLRSALSHAHFASVIGRRNAGHCLIVECNVSERSRIREILEQTLLDSLDVHFLDESA